MAGYKETPRQKMIGMMYLILTALLALNVSKDILQAFVIVNESLVATQHNYDQKLQDSYASFDVQYSLNPVKVKPYIDKAKEVKKKTDELVEYVKNLEYEVIAKVQGIPVAEAKKLPLDEVDAKDNYDIPTQYFIGDSQDGSAGKARELKNKITDYKADLYKIIGKDTALIKLGAGLSTKDYHNKIEGKVTWEMGNFHHTVLAGTITILNKIILDAQNTESDIVRHLYRSISAEDFKFDQIGAKVIPKSDYVLQGDRSEADVIVAAYDTKQNPEIFYQMGTDSIRDFEPDKMQKVEGERGLGKLKIGASALGPQKYAGVIRIISPSGQKKLYNFHSDYIVAKPSVTVSADKMNVFYIGVDNPVSISAPGIAESNLKPTITAGTLTQTGPGKYTVKVGKGILNTKINVNAQVEGKSKLMGSADFRVKSVPNPVAYIANKKSGTISKSELLAGGAIIPKMENFDFELFPVVTEFSLTTLVSGDLIEKRGTGNRLTEEMKKVVGNLRKGQKVYIENIKAKLPDGSTRTLSSINLTIN